MVIVQEATFDTGTEIKHLTDRNTQIGAVVSFTGLVRDFNDGSAIQSLTLEHYPGMTEKELEKIETQALERWDLTESLIIHRYGKMDLGDPIVLVITASAHRKDAFEAAAFLMDWLKTKAPFWKLEENASGNQNWVSERSSDIDAAEEWE
ncbi:molybdenum cofactor biosynthesis protein MoaE [Alphaproteobacteria bacterium 46_93_T64]|nr:molybdenum cofactor biosynthesis protein MoaE [Alphaproteobacteria bacterium 46_93_T64]